MDASNPRKLEGNLDTIAPTTALTLCREGSDSGLIGATDDLWVN